MIISLNLSEVTSVPDVPGQKPECQVVYKPEKTNNNLFDDPPYLHHSGFMLLEYLFRLPNKISQNE